MRKIIILAFGCMLFSSCVDGELSLNEVQPKLREDVTFVPFPEKPIDTIDSEKKKKRRKKRTRRKIKGIKMAKK